MKTSFFNSLVFILLCVFFFSCEEEEFQNVERNAKSKTNQKASVNVSEEKANDDMTPLLYFGAPWGCIPIDNLCTRVVIVTSELQGKKDALDEAIANGKVEELPLQFFQKLFPDLKKEQIEGLISGEVALCKVEGTEGGERDNSDETYYIAYDPEDKSCEEAKESKNAREWVVPLQDQT